MTAYVTRFLIKIYLQNGYCWQSLIISCILGQVNGKELCAVDFKTISERFILPSSYPLVYCPMEVVCSSLKLGVHHQTFFSHSFFNLLYCCVLLRITWFLVIVTDLNAFNYYRTTQSMNFIKKAADGGWAVFYKYYEVPFV